VQGSYAPPAHHWLPGHQAKNALQPEANAARLLQHLVLTEREAREVGLHQLQLVLPLSQ
jgi:hypothetical protein